MSYPPLLTYTTIPEFQGHFERTYCCGPVTTHDGIQVSFTKPDFSHCCYARSFRTGPKDTFDVERAKRIDWIRPALEDAAIEMFIGWDTQRNCADAGRRVCIAKGDFVVVIRQVRLVVAKFVTSYIADAKTLAQIRSGKRISTGNLWG